MSKNVNSFLVMMHEESYDASLNKMMHYMMKRRCQGCEITGGSRKQDGGRCEQQRSMEKRGQ